MTKRELITVSISPDWLPLVQEKASSKSWYITHYIRELIRADLNLPPSLLDFNRPPRRGKREFDVTNSTKMQVNLPRKAHTILMGIVVQKNWSISTVIQRIIEVDLAPMPSKAILRPPSKAQLVREYSEEGSKFGAEYWEQYYQEHPQSPIVNVSYNLPLDWQEALQAKANMSATTVYKLVRGAIMKRLGE